LDWGAEELTRIKNQRERTRNEQNWIGTPPKPARDDFITGSIGNGHISVVVRSQTKVSVGRQMMKPDSGIVVYVVNYQNWIKYLNNEQFEMISNR
jgi:hypothetical protein